MGMGQTGIAMGTKSPKKKKKKKGVDCRGL